MFLLWVILSHLICIIGFMLTLKAQTGDTALIIKAIAIMTIVLLFAVCMGADILINLIETRTFI